MVQNKKNMHKWSADRVKILVSMWGSGFSAKQVAEKLGQGVTRNAVIGKINRMGISKKNKKSKDLYMTNLVEFESYLRNTYTLTKRTSLCKWTLAADKNLITTEVCNEAVLNAKEDYCAKHLDMAYRNYKPKS